MMVGMKHLKNLSVLSLLIFLIAACSSDDQGRCPSILETGECVFPYIEPQLGDVTDSFTFYSGGGFIPAATVNTYDVVFDLDNQRLSGSIPNDSQDAACEIDQSLTASNVSDLKRDLNRVDFNAIQNDMSMADCLIEYIQPTGYYERKMYFTSSICFSSENTHLRDEDNLLYNAIRDLIDAASDATPECR